jgi:hypothetical protein
VKRRKNFDPSIRIWTWSLDPTALKLSKKDDDKVCAVSIKYSGGTAQIDEDNCSFYHGAACAFDRSMTKKE